MISIIEFTRKIPLRFGITRSSDFYLVLICYFFVCLSGGLSSTFTEMEMHSLHIFSPRLTSVAFTMWTIGGLLQYLTYPSLSKFFSLKFLVLSSLVLASLTTGLFSLFLNTDINFLLQFLSGFTICLFFNALNCYTSVLYNTSSRTTLFGIVTIIFSLSYALGSSLLDFILNIDAVFLISAFFLLIPVGAGLLLSYPPLVAKAPSPLEKSSWLSTWSYFPVLFILALVLGIGFGAQDTYFPIYAEGLGLTEGRASVLYAVTLIGSILIVPVASWRADIIGYPKVFLWLTLVGMGATLWVIFTHSLIAISILYFLITGILAAYTTLAIAWVAKAYVGKNSLSTAMSLQGIMSQLGGVLSPLAIGTFMSTFGNNGYNCWVLLGFIACLVPLAIVWYTKKNSLQEKNAAPSAVPFYVPSTKEN